MSNRLKLAFILFMTKLIKSNFKYFENTLEIQVENM